MKTSLLCHRAAPQSTLTRIEVTVAPPRGDCIGLSFRAVGDVDAIRWPGDRDCGDGPWHRGDRLWESTCFEAFLRRAGGAGYREINLATSGCWAAYAFEGYREGMAEADDIRMLGGKWRIRDGRAELHVLLGLPPGFRREPLSLGLSAVMKGVDGGTSYWALAHPRERPDFHDPACFALELPAAG
ncbi:DOMON-like domain-containing protein [Stakelama saccharophila]|uniref:DOMON-like domain-containing protein n=1 Tax=Stakelama saccharophila TaxID=3075605 RepID=A0ABZ0B6T8_9SPHN|nr:DOMON-like domain-containing protein [Stakelama sp. W311]WNO52598.1 DOMON-like domain-containing protein [Stakelama sp. W311]